MINPPKTECDCLHGGVIENVRTRKPLTLWTVPVPVLVWVHILGDPQSVQLRDATTATFRIKICVTLNEYQGQDI